MNYIKTFENLYDGEDFYKIVSKADWLKIIDTSVILPIGKVKRGDTTYRGNWAIPMSNIDKWLTPIKYFGSPLQALLMKSAFNSQERVLLKIKVSKNNMIYNRDITKMFIDHSFRGYYSSFSSNDYYNITESFITGVITSFSKVNEFVVPIEIGEYVAEPYSVLDFVMGNGHPVYTDRKMTSIRSALFMVLLRKIFSFNIL